MDNIMLKKGLSNEQLTMVESELENKKKDKVIMYLLWVFTGGIGGHRFYLGDIGYGFGMLFVNWATLGIWGIIDLFIIGKRLEFKTNEIESDIIIKVKALSDT